MILFMVGVFARFRKFIRLRKNKNTALRVEWRCLFPVKNLKNGLKILEVNSWRT
jgi:hypothetical protein